MMKTKFVLLPSNDTDADVYSEKSWKFFDEERKRLERIRLERTEDDVVSLSSDDEKPRPVPSIELFLQCGSDRTSIRVAAVKFDFEKLLIQTDDKHSNPY